MITLLEFLLKKHIDIDPDCVDLDLPSKTLWGKCNLDAKNPEEKGGYYAWGESETKKEYSAKNYKYIDLKNFSLAYPKYIKYCDDDGKLELDDSDDAAYVKTKGEFRMPTGKELKELLSHTDIKVGSLKGVKGVKFCSLVNPNKFMFVPFSGSFETNYFLAKYQDYFKNHLYKPMCDTTMLVIPSRERPKVIDFKIIAMHKYHNDADAAITSKERFAGYTIRPVKNTK